MLPKGQALAQENRILRTQIFSALRDQTHSLGGSIYSLRCKKNKNISMIFMNLENLNAFYDFSSYK